jgi:hypothetical protein
MGAIRFRPARLSAALVGSALAWAALTADALAGQPPLRDEPPVWRIDDRGDIPEPKERDPNLLRDGIDESFFDPLGRLFNPSRLIRKLGTPFGADHVPAASNVNSVDEVPNSSWFTNRIGLYPMSPDEVARGPVQDGGPSRSGPWTVVSAKTEGVTPGFNIRDERGDVYLIKFDAACCPGMSSAAGVISGRLLHAAGYNVPEDFVVTFRREDLVLGEKVRITDPDGTKRPMTLADIDSILVKVAPDAAGARRAIASKFLRGKPVGPFDWEGRRDDDPFDTVRHENRRELRGLRVIAAWLAHFDMKQLNTLDMYVEDGGRHHVRHHLIDFASTLGAGASGPFPSGNYEYVFDFPAMMGRAFSLGIHQSPWERIERPDGLVEVGYLESKEFEPSKWKPLDPNASFANLTDRDGYWGAKIVSAFTDTQIETAVAEGRYQNPEAAAYVVRMLRERRDKVARHWFDRIPPLDFFTVDGDRLRFHDLGDERGIYPGTTPRYRLRAAAVRPDRGGASWTDWIETPKPELDLAEVLTREQLRSAPQSERPFLAVEARVDRGSGWSRTVTIYVARASGRVVAMAR